MFMWRDVFERRFVKALQYKQRVYISSSVDM